MSEYAIKIVTRRDGSKTFYPMKKGLLWGWNYFNESYGSYSLRISGTFGDAVAFLREQIGREVVSTELVVDPIGIRQDKRFAALNPQEDSDG